MVAPVVAKVKSIPTLFTNHALVLILIGSDNTLRMRELSQKIGITERAVQRIVDELVGCGHIMILKSGRRNSYLLNTSVRLRLPEVYDLRLETLLGLVNRGRLIATDQVTFASSKVV